jgi:hypothetical protein
MSKNNSYSTLSPFLNLPIVVNTNVILLEFNTSGVGVASTILTTDVTVAIGIKHLRCLVAAMVQTVASRKNRTIEFYRQNI